jgi:uncharacterized protein (DUF111 family)
VSRELLLLAQVDDAPGEVLGTAIDLLLEAGARNVQVAPTTTKKGRPGHLVLVDVPTDAEDEVALVLAVELGVWGYHVLESRHRRFDVACEPRRLTVGIDGERLTFELTCKLVRRAGALVRVKAEHDDVVRIRRALAERGRMLPISVVRASLEQELRARPEDPELDLVL